MQEKCFFLLINVKMPTSVGISTSLNMNNVGILTCMSRINSSQGFYDPEFIFLYFIPMNFYNATMLNSAGHEKFL